VGRRPFVAWDLAYRFHRRISPVLIFPIFQLPRRHSAVRYNSLSLFVAVSDDLAFVNSI